MNNNHIDRLTRADRDIIGAIVPEGAHVLDLGCGDGGLLAELTDKKGVAGRGVDINWQSLINAMERGLSVYHGNLDEGLADFPDNAYDYVILNQTLQVITKPRTVIKEMLRVGKCGIVGFPNFGHWHLRLSLLLRGRMPKSRRLPFEWHDTPNIHQLTIKDFKDFCREEDISIIREEYFMLGKWRWSTLVNPLANVLALTGMFVITRTR
ncbi:methionine biosynthesis protein MetW [bacterium]|nr:methionine biosynthesis protein MetW [bacterium]